MTTLEITSEEQQVLQDLKEALDKTLEDGLQKTVAYFKDLIV